MDGFEIIYAIRGHDKDECDMVFDTWETLVSYLSSFNRKKAEKIVPFEVVFAVKVVD